MRISDWSSDVCSSDLGLLRRTTWTIDRRTGRGFGQARCEYAITSHVHRLLANLADATGDDVFDGDRINATAVEHTIDDLTEQVGGMPARQAAVLAAAGGAGERKSTRLNSSH